MNKISQGIEVELNRDTLKELGYSIEENKDKQKIIKKIIKNGQEVTSLCIPATYIYHGLKYKITTFGENIFSNCIFLKEIELPDSIVEIKETAFWDCESLTKITFPKNLVKINKYAFQHCKSLQTITIPDSVTEIGVNAFSHCESLISVKLSKNLTKISKNTFFSCKSLQDIIFPDYLTEIAERSFWCCKSLQSIKLPDSIIEIGESAFSGCEKLNIIVPENIKEIGKKAFQDCLNVNCKGKIKRNCGAKKINNKLIKKENEEKYKKILYTILTLIFFSCFISIFQPIPPDAKVHSIYFLNFFRFAILAFFIWLIWLIWKPEKKNKIRESTLNNSVLKALGYKKYDNSLNNSTILYYNEQEITSLNIPSVYDNNGEKCKITKIGNDVFSNCKNLIEVKIPDSITKIDKKAFLNCTNLKNINISDSVKEIGEDAFWGCNYLPPEIRKKIENKIISDNEFTFKIETNDKINKRVRNWLLFLFISLIIILSMCFFLEGEKYEKISGGSGCSFFLIGGVLYCVLYWWPNRCEVNNRTLKSLGYKNKFKVPLIEIPKTYKIKDQDKHGIKYYTYKIIRIGDNAFKDCKNLKQITIPDSINEIGKNAFNGCTGLEKLIIPDSVFEIGENAFKDVENVIYHGNAIGSPWGAKNLNKE